ASLEVSADILSRLLDCLEPEIVLAQLRDDLYMGMGHPNEHIRQVCLHQVERLVESDIGRNNLKNDEELLANVVSTVGDESLAVAKIAMKSLKSLSRDPAEIKLIFEGNLRAPLKRVAASNDTIKYRVLEIATSVSIVSPVALEIVNNSELLQMLLSDLHTEDDLVQLNAIEMLCVLVDCPHGISFLEEVGVLRKLEEMLKESEQDPSQDFLLPELIKFFGALARHQPKEVSERYPAFLRCSFKLLEGCEAALVNIAVETLGFIGTSTDGKRTLNKQGKSMTDALSILGRLIQVPPTEVRVRALSALACLFSVQKDEMNEDLEAMLEQWFAQVSSKPFELILSLCRQPFMEIRCPSLSILEALCNHRWAQTVLSNSPGFHEYLLDRSTEHEKIGKEAKYTVVKALAEAYHTADVFGRPYLLKT
ncbi:putative 26S proteasome non-ATPase regulatory subunit 5-like, partial [Apostichopus japonicus]